MRRDDSDDASGEGGRPGGDPSWIEHVVVPDDISELDAEVRAWQRERRARARRERLRRLASPSSVSGPLVIVALLLIAGLASLVVLFQPRRLSTQPAPLATPGVTGNGRTRLLPDVPVQLEDGSTRPVRDYRPAVLALAPIGCGCDAALRDVGSTVVRYGIPFLLVDRSVPPAPAGLRGPDVVRLAEPTGTLAADFRAETAGRRRPGGPVLVLVGGDGQVVRTLARPTAARALEPDLAGLSLSRTSR